MDEAMTGDEARIREIERRLKAIPIVSLEGRIARLEQLGWQDLGGRPSVGLGVRVWIVRLLGCYGLPLAGETVSIIDFRSSGLPTIGSADTDSSGWATVVTYGGDVSGDVIAAAAPSRFDASSFAPVGGSTPYYLNGPDNSVTISEGSIDPDASHVPGPLNDPRPWGLTATLSDAALGVSGATLTYGANAGHDSWYGTTTGNFSAGGGCAAASGIPLAYEVYLDSQALVTWRFNGSNCPTAGSFVNLKTDTLATITGSPGAFTATASGLVGTSKLYPGGSPTFAITGT